MTASISGLLRCAAPLVGLACVLAPAPALAQAVFNLNIPAQDLGSALRAFGLAARQPLIFDERMVQGKRSPPLVGAYSAAAALRSLLANTALSAYRTRGGAIAIGLTEPPDATAIVRAAERPPSAGAAGEAPPTAGPASADAAQRAAPAAAATPAPPVSAPPAPLQEVVVTGSRVIRNGNAMPSPVTVVSTDQLTALQPGPVAEALVELPAFAGSRTAVGNPGTGVTNAGADELNLRYLGYARTLVLFDGHRVPPSTYDQVVDVDMIPQMLLQRVDVVTGGVSAVYGSDAVAGVVNFITDTKFNGLKLNADVGESNAGDDRTVDAGVAVGRSFLGERAHIEFSYEYRNDPGIMYRTDRAWGQQVWTEQGGGTAADPYRLVRDTRFANYTFGGLISGATGAGAALNGQTFAADGVLSPFVNGAPTGNPAYQSGGSGADYDGSLKYALDANKVFGRFDYDVTDAIHGYLEATDSLNHTLNYGQYNQINGDTFSGANAFLPASYRFAGTFKLSEFLQDMPRIDTNTQENQYFMVAGLDGRSDGYSWNVAYSHSVSRSTTRDDNDVNNQNLAAALDAVVDPADGQVVCRASLTSSAYANCAPLDLFGPTAASAAALAYITQPTEFTVTNGMDDISGSVSGAPIKDWAGPVNMALSGEWRRQSFSVFSTATPTQLANCAGLAYNCAPNTPLWADATLADRSPVSESVGEGAFELDAPLLKDLPFIQDLSFNGAVRYTDYSVSGSAWTWKAGLVWRIDDEWKLRATRSRDIRAPTLYDLYQPTSVGLVTATDMLTGVSKPTPTYTGGNPNLASEVGETTTAGFVYIPKWLPGFSLSMDGYYIDVSDAIVSEIGYNPTEQVLCDASGGSSAYCDLQARPLGYANTTAANAVSAWYVEEVNISDIRTYGADFEANYAASVFGNPLTLRGLLTWQPHYVTVTPGSPTQESAGIAFASTGGGGAFAVPRVRLSVLANYKIQNFDLGLMERWRSSLSLAGTPGQVYAAPDTAPSTAYTNINLDYRLAAGSGGSTELFLNIQNLFNTMPPPAAGSGQSGNVGTFDGFALGDDPIGRYFTLGVRFRH